MTTLRKLVIFCFVCLSITVTNVIANSITLTNAAGYAHGVYTSTTNGTHHHSANYNYTACALTANESAGYGDSNCVYVGETATVSVTKPDPGVGHYHVYKLYPGQNEESEVGVPFWLWVTYNFGNWPIYY